MNLRYVYIVFLIAVAFSCSDDEKPKGKYEHGAIIVNEGGFGSGNGTVTFYNTSTTEVEQNILRATATGFAGDVAQSITFKDDKAYLVLNGDSKIQIADANTFETESIIAGADIVAPRYIEVINGKAYISVWGPYDANYSLIDSYVLVYDLSTGTVLKKIDTDEGTENLLYNGSYLFASNYNYGGSSTLAVINPSDNTLVKQIELSAGPSGMVTDANNKLWVVCSGWNSGNLYRINPSTLAIEATIEISASPGTDLAITPDKQNILYTVGKSVYKLPIGSTSEASTALINSDVKAFYTFNVNPDNGDIWIGDALNYATTGKVYIYSADGTAKSSFEAGISPGQFKFK